MPTQSLAVIFDMDGVLVDSYRAHFESWLRLYAELGLEYSEAAFAADFGRTSRDILGRRFDKGLTDARIQELDQKKEAFYRDIIRADFPVMDGARELIDGLAADGFLLAVGSSGPPANIELSLAKLGRREKFAATVTGADVTRGKPDPQVFQLAAQRVGVDPASCAVIEDAPHGVEAARNAGMKCIALTGTADRNQLAAADLIAESLRELNAIRIRSLIVRGAAGR